MAFLELNPELKRFTGRLELKNKRLGPLWTGLFLTALAPRLVSGQAALQDAVKHLHHFLFRRLARNL